MTANLLHDRFACGTVRQTELSVLRARLAGVRDGRGGLVEVAGDPGTGKTRLLSSVAAEAADLGLAVAWGRGTESDRHIDFRSLTELFDNRPPFDQPLPEASQPVPVQVSYAVRDQLQAELQARAAAAPSDAEYHRRVYPALRNQLARVAGDGLIILLDDFHWADRRSAYFMSFLASHPVAAPLLIVISHRPRQACPQLRAALADGAKAAVGQVALGPLTIEQSAQVLGMHPSDQQLPELHDRSGGNPLYLLAVAQTGLPQTAGGTAVQLSGDIAYLPPDSALVAKAAAVAGRDCDVSELAEIAGLSYERAGAAVADLCDRDVLRQSADGTGLRFRHPLLRDVAYSSTNAYWRVTAHRRALALLTRRGAAAAQRAIHVERSWGAVKAEDLAVLEDAAAESMVSAPHKASRLLQVAIRRTADLAARSRLRLSLAKALIAQGQLSGALSLLHDMIRNDPALTGASRAPVVAECALVECLLGRYAEANAMITAELAALPPAEPSARVRLVARQAIIGLLDGELPEWTAVEAALARARELADRVAVTGALALLGLLAAYKGDIKRAAALADECTSGIDELSQAELVDFPDQLALLGWTERILARFAAAERHLNRQVYILRQAGTCCMLPIVLLQLSMNYQAVTRLSEARTAAVEAGRIARELGAADIGELATMLEAISRAWTDRRDGEHVVAQVDKALASRRPRNWWFGFHAVLALALILQEEGQHEACATLVLHVGGGSDLTRIPSAIRPHCFEMLAAAAARTANAAAAAAWAERAATAASSLGRPYQLASALQARGHWLAVQRDHATAAAQYAQAAELFASAGLPSGQIRALLLAAHHSGLSGQPANVCTHLALARHLALESGSPRLAEDVERAHRAALPSAATGLMPAAPPPVQPPLAQATDDVDLSILTSREREIAQIAASGKRTKDIARELSVSPRTVDTHLTHVYQKLNITSRAALASLLARSS
jgi:DNA-binding CsgD family transcriptional regulator